MKQIPSCCFTFYLVPVIIDMLFHDAEIPGCWVNIGDLIKLPLVWVCIAAFFLLLLSYGMIGVIENKGFSYEAWQANTERSRTKALLAWFIKWGRLIPFLLGYALFVYMMAPGSVSMLIALLGGIVISNMVSFFINKKMPEAAKAK